MIFITLIGLYTTITPVVVQLPTTRPITTQLPDSLSFEQKDDRGKKLAGPEAWVFISQEAQAGGEGVGGWCVES